MSEGEYAVNQSAEQIIFEVEPGWVTAHVLIRYSGDPSQFAWIVPVPELPELAISPSSAFGIIDRATSPDIVSEIENICPVSEYECRSHPYRSCGFAAEGASDDDFGASADAGAGGAPPVDVLGEQVVGDYQTVTFRASEASAAVQWLRDNGFLVNQTTSIYMESYVQANMVFVAAKLVPGASSDAIKPLRLKYRSAFPMVPLVLTAVAAQPHLTVTSFIYSDAPFRPLGHPVVDIDGRRIAQDPTGRLNYPMVLARTIDEAGGDAFAIEYRGGPAQPSFGQSGGCCGNGDFDVCNIGFDGQCQCPGDAFDANDCAAVGDLNDGVTLVRDLALRHTHLTRLTTRVSAEEMTFDPQFEPDRDAALDGRLRVVGSQPTLSGCENQVIDTDAFNTVTALQGCAAMYCGPGGSCVTTQNGPACACDAEHVVQQFTDLDGKTSVTCVPLTPPCDYRAGGDVLPDACATTSCGNGRCVDRNGVAVCDCDDGNAAHVGLTAPKCDPIVLASNTPGADDFSEPLRQLEVCAPAPPSCGEDSWLEKVGTTRPGLDCGNTKPAVWLTWPKPEPTCGVFDCGGCQGSQEAAPLGVAAGAWVVLGLVLLRRRRR